MKRCDRCGHVADGSVGGDVRSFAEQDLCFECATQFTLDELLPQLEEALDDD